MVEINKSQYKKLDKENIFADFKREHGFPAYSKTRRKYYMVESPELMKALAKLNASI